MYWLRSAVLLADGSGDVLCDLCRIQQTRSPLSRFSLQRLHRAVPTIIPILDGPTSSRDPEALSQRIKPATPAIGLVLAKNELLQLWWAELHDRGRERRMKRRTNGGTDWKGPRSARKRREGCRTNEMSQTCWNWNEIEL